MSRDDYISKLFIKNQGKLEQAPSADLWSKLEAQLDVEPAGASVAPSKGVIRRLWLPYVAAASVLLVTLVGGYYNTFWRDASSDETTTKQPIALANEADFLEDEPEPYVAPPKETNNVALILEEQAEEEERAQEQRIVEAVRERLEQDPTEQVVEEIEEIKLNDIQVADEAEQKPVEWVEPTPKVGDLGNSASSNVATTTLGTDVIIPEQPADFYQNNEVIQEEKENAYNYSNTNVPQLSTRQSNSAVNAQQIDKAIAKAEQRQAPTKTIATTKAEIKLDRRQRGGIVAQADESERIKSPMADAHPRLYPFGFLIGKWEDDQELEGKSYEVWTLRDRKTLVGKGYKLSSDGTRVFEETFKIVYKNGQVFLQVRFDEGTRPVEYLLTSFDQERFVFEQRQYARQPDRIVLQQNGLEGYSFTISNIKEFLSADQQRYLAQRNRVSNVRSSRTLRAAQ